MGRAKLQPEFELAPLRVRADSATDKYFTATTDIYLHAWHGLNLSLFQRCIWL